MKDDHFFYKWSTTEINILYIFILVSSGDIEKTRHGDITNSIGIRMNIVQRHKKFSAKANLKTLFANVRYFPWNIKF